jgi:glycosyltransferase involved in cell wall biosynthesis
MQAAAGQGAGGVGQGGIEVLRTSDAGTEELGGAKKPRLLIVVNVPWFFVMHRLPIAVMARSRGVDVHIACGEGAGVEDIGAAGFPFHRLPLTRNPFAPWRDVKTIAALLGLYRELRPEVVHHVTLKPIVLGSIAARLAGIPGVINNYSGLGSAFLGDSWIARVRRWVIQRLIAWSIKLPKHRAVFENQDDRELLISERVVGADESLVIAGVGVDTDEFLPAPEPPPPVKVLMAGRMLREKGVLYFVESARRLKHRGIDAKFLLVGAPDTFNAGTISEAELKLWSEEGVVEWVGFRSDMPQVVRDAHVLCLPTYYREGVPRILIEGAASGRPLVTTNMPGCRDIVKDGVNGFVVPPHDVDALAEALERLVCDARLRAQFGAAGRTLAERRFALQIVLQQLWAVYVLVGLPGRSG